MSAVISIGGLTMPPPDLKLKYIPTTRNMSKCYTCHIFHDPRLNPNAKEFIPRRPAGVENTAPYRKDAGLVGGGFGQVQVFAFNCVTQPYKSKKSVLCPANRPPPSLPGSRAWEAGPSSASMSSTCPVLTGSGQLTGVAAAPPGTGPRESAKAASRCTVSGPGAVTGGGAANPPHSPLGGTRQPAADARLQCRAEEGNQRTDTVTAQNGGTERPTTPPLNCDKSTISFTKSTISPTNATETELCRKIASVLVCPGSDVSCTSSDSGLSTSDTSKRARSPSQCSDSTMPRRSVSRDLPASTLAMCMQAAITAASSVIPRQSSSTSCPGTPSDCDAPASASSRWRTLSSSSASISIESGDESSDESSDEEDSTLGDEWDASAATFLPGSSVDSADDFICFVSDGECHPAEPTTSNIPQTPEFGPCPDQADSGLSAETDPSDSEPADSSGDEDDLSEAGCGQCLSAPAGTCSTHERIAEANRELPRWCDTPPPQPRTSKVRFLSGDRLATVHAAPDYDRGIASDLLDQQRQRDRLRRWRQDVDLRVAPVLAAVLSPEHRQRVLRERPELVRSS